MNTSEEPGMDEDDRGAGGAISSGGHRGTLESAGTERAATGQNG